MESFGAISTSALPSRFTRVVRLDQLVLGCVVHPAQVGGDENVGRRALLDLLGERGAGRVARDHLDACGLAEGGVGVIECILKDAAANTVICSCAIAAGAAEGRRRSRERRKRVQTMAVLLKRDTRSMDLGFGIEIDRCRNRRSAAADGACTMRPRAPGVDDVASRATDGRDKPGHDSAAKWL